MQNWDTFKFVFSITPIYAAMLLLVLIPWLFQYVFSHLNQLPKESHDTDFSRVKPWYLDEKCVIACCRLPVVNLISCLVPHISVKASF